MKKLTFLAVLLIASLNSFAFTVVDSMYDSTYFDIVSQRSPASQGEMFCILTSEHKVFANSCYSSADTCQKRLDFWKDLPGAKQHRCAKI
jgi:hypothetical protein